MSWRNSAKAALHAAACVTVAPSVASFHVRARLLGADRAMTGSSQFWALVPGLPGQYLRRAFLSMAAARCGRDAVIEFGTLFSAAGVSIGDRAYIGPRCHIGLASIEADALLAAGVHVPSGAHTHGTSSVDTPMRDQPGAKHRVRIGSGAWIGSAAVVMADVGRDAVVGAGAVVTKPVPDRVVAGGVPAKVIKARGPHAASA